MKSQVDYREQVGMLRKLLTPLSPRWVRWAAAVAGLLLWLGCCCGWAAAVICACGGQSMAAVGLLNTGTWEVCQFGRACASRVAVATQVAGQCRIPCAPWFHINQPRVHILFPLPQDVTLLHFRKTGNRFATALLGLRIPDAEVRRGKSMAMCSMIVVP